MKKKTVTAAARRDISRRRPSVKAPGFSVERRTLAARIELGAGILLTLVVIGLHGIFLTHAGALWRDETQIFNVSTAPTFAEQWQLNEHDTFPLLWQLTLRSWKVAGLAGTDFGLRFLGFLVGLTILGMLWYCARQFEAGSPLVSIAIFGLSPTVLIFGDSIRGYGFGMVWLLFMIARLWRMVREPSIRNTLWAGAAVLLAVHSFYFSVVFFAVLWGVATGIFLYRRAWRPAISATGIGVIAAASMLPYVAILRRQFKWHAFLQIDVSAEWLLETFTDAVNSAGKNAIWVWTALLAIVLIVCVRDLLRSKSDKDRMLFVGGMVIAGPVVYILFLMWRRQPTHAWYYIGIMGFLAVAIEAGVARMVADSWRGRQARWVFAIVGACVFTVTAWPLVHLRMTNIDQVATVLSEKATKEDFILINPWWPGVTFTRYYRGPTPWTTLPDLGPLPVQRFDLFREKLFETEPIRPVLDRITQTLKDGHRVWIVGGLTFLKPGEEPGNVPPAPVGPIAEGPHMEAWSRQAGYLVQSHVTKANVVPVPANNPVSRYENFRLMVVEGWR